MSLSPRATRRVYPSPTRNGNHLEPPNDRRSRRSVTSETSDTPPTAPLIPPDVEQINPPLANPEIDDSGDDREVANRPYPGVDDGFFNNNNPETDKDEEDGKKRVASPKDQEPAYGPHGPDFYDLPEKPSLFPDFPDPEFGGLPSGESIPDVNVYQHKKTLAQGMMDLALFSANSNQLRYVLESDRHPYYYVGVTLISISLIFQVGDIYFNLSLISSNVKQCESFILYTLLTTLCPRI